jgi:hypothetical protein
MFSMNPYKLNPLHDSAIIWTKIYNHHPVFIKIYQIIESGHHLCFSLWGEIAAKNRLVDRLSKTKHRLMNPVEPLRLPDIIANYITVQATHLMSPYNECRIKDIYERLECWFQLGQAF